MEEQYRQFRIESGRRTDNEAWFRVSEGDVEVFSLTLYLTPPAPGLADMPVPHDPGRVGRLMVRGMLDLGRYEPGRRYREIRAPEWSTRLRETDITDEQIGVELLYALARLGPGAQHQLDVEAVATVMGTGVGRIHYVLATLAAEGWIETASGGADEAGAARLLPAGAARLAELWPAAARSVLPESS